MKDKDTECTIDEHRPKRPRLLGVKWTAQDALCAKLFGPWDELPCSDFGGHADLLRDLDHIIITFEARIQHSDAGFRAWRRLHKWAMDSGLHEVPGFPSLRLRRDGVNVWQDDVWEQRYRYLIYQRHQMILARLKKRFTLSPRQREEFFGTEAAPPRETMKRRTRGFYCRRLDLRCDWWQPLDFLLEKAARDWRMDARRVKSLFWLELDKKPAAAVKAEPCRAVSEPQGQPSKGLAKVVGSMEPRNMMDLSMILNDKPQGVASSVPVGGQMGW